MFRKSVKRLAVFATVLLIGLGGVAASGRLKARQVPELHRWPEELLKQNYPGYTRPVLEGAPELTLYSVNPNQWVEGKEKKETFHDYVVLGKAVVRDEEKRRILRALFSYYFFDEKHPLVSALCFNPRHGLRARDPKTGRTVDILICFSCHTGYIYASDGTEQGFQAFDLPLKEEMNHIFQKQGISVAP